MDSPLTIRGQQARDGFFSSYDELVHTTGFVRHPDLYSRWKELFRAFGEFWVAYWGAFPNTEANIINAENFAKCARQLLQTKYKYDAFNSFMRRIKCADIGNLCVRHMADSPAHNKWAADSLHQEPRHECSQRCYFIEGRCLDHITLSWLWTEYRDEQDGFQAWLREGVSGRAYTPQPRHPWSDFFRDFADYQNGLYPDSLNQLAPWDVTRVVYDTWLRESGRPRSIEEFMLYGEQKYVAQVQSDVVNCPYIMNVGMPLQLQGLLYSRVVCLAIAMENYRRNPYSGWAPYWRAQEWRENPRVHLDLAPFPIPVCDVVKFNTGLFVFGGKVMAMCYFEGEGEGVYVEIGSVEEGEHLAEVVARDETARIERWLDDCLAAGCGAPDEDEYEDLESEESESEGTESGASEYEVLEDETPEDGAPEDDAPESDAPESDGPPEDDAPEGEASEHEARAIDTYTADEESGLDEADLYEEVYHKTTRYKVRTGGLIAGRCKKW
ncbi:hypothetical protein CTRI78_v000139 [Colletotrichum trifolii]|uniref:Uncharacterized protein n=1 Tax=Colletotrichum trifolii TaxID=5466 RepID=A0A4R8RTS8_COLTR|nr:hypothetical protein CTRI78_v000139 [Colletotrichum trifolii]